jgi:hypothetical protein
VIDIASFIFFIVIFSSIVSVVFAFVFNNSGWFFRRIQMCEDDLSPTVDNFFCVSFFLEPPEKRKHGLDVCQRLLGHLRELWRPLPGKVQGSASGSHARSGHQAGIVAQEVHLLQAEVCEEAGLLADLAHGLVAHAH